MSLCVLGRNRAEFSLARSICAFKEKHRMHKIRGWCIVRFWIWFYDCTRKSELNERESLKCRREGDKNKKRWKKALWDQIMFEFYHKASVRAKGFSI